VALPGSGLRVRACPWSSAVPSSWPPCSLRWWRLRHRGATPSGAIDSAIATWTISGRGSGKLRIQGFSNHYCGSLWIVLVTCGFRDCERWSSVVFGGCSGCVL
jgi:hypothetical protein